MNNLCISFLFLLHQITTDIMLKITQIYFFTNLRSKSAMGLTDTKSSPRSVWLHFFQQDLGKTLTCLFQHLQVACIPWLSPYSFIFNTSKIRLNNFLWVIFSAFSLILTILPLSKFMNPCDYTESTGIIQDNPIYKNQ